MLKFISPMLTTNDLKASVDFYTNILEFECSAYEESWGWACLYKDNIQIMFASPNAHDTAYVRPIFTGSLYIYTNEVDAWWLKLKDKCRVLYPIEDFEYNMREFCILDNNDYRLQYGMTINNLAEKAV